VVEGGAGLGSSLLFSFLSWIIFGQLPDNIDVILHPIAFSGWIGLLVTCLNLLPVGQLDGGHIAYAVFGEKQRIMAKIVLFVLIVLGLTGWMGWLVWAVILLFMKLGHPRCVRLDPSRPDKAGHRLGGHGYFRDDLYARTLLAFVHHPPIDNPSDGRYSFCETRKWRG